MHVLCSSLSLEMVQLALIHLLQDTVGWEPITCNLQPPQTNAMLTCSVKSYFPGASCACVSCSLMQLQIVYVEDLLVKTKPNHSSQKSPDSVWQLPINCEATQHIPQTARIQRYQEP